MKKTKKQSKLRAFFKSAFYKVSLRVVLIIVVLVSLLLNLFTFITPVVKYYGEGMSDTLSDGQILIVSKLSRIESGDIIAFYYNNKVLVRRVIATGSQQVEIDAFGSVSVNGNELDESYVSNKTLGQCNIDFPYSVPAGSYFVLGDNRALAMDSRLSEIGTVAKDRIIGKVIFSIKPFGFVK